MDLEKIPTDPVTYKQDQRWLTYLDVERYKVHIPSGDMPEPLMDFNCKTLFVDGFPDCKLFDFNPWNRNEISTLMGCVTKRMERARRGNVELFLKRTFTTNNDEACIHSSHFMCCV